MQKHSNFIIILVFFTISVFSTHSYTNSKCFSKLDVRNIPWNCVKYLCEKFIYNIHCLHFLYSKRNENALNKNLSNNFHKPNYGYSEEYIDNDERDVKKNTNEEYNDLVQLELMKRRDKSVYENDWNLDNIAFRETIRQRDEWFDIRKHNDAIHQKDHTRKVRGKRSAKWRQSNGPLNELSDYDFVSLGSVYTTVRSSEEDAMIGSDSTLIRKRGEYDKDSVHKVQKRNDSRDRKGFGRNILRTLMDKLEISENDGQEEDDDDNDDAGEKTISRKKRKKKKKLKKFLLPLLLAYKLKFFALIPVMIGGLVIIAGSTGLAGFFFALFSAVMSLKGSHLHG